MATSPMRMVDSIASSTLRGARSGTLCIRFAAVSADQSGVLAGRLRVDIGGTTLDCNVLAGQPHGTGEWVAIVNERDAWLILGQVNPTDVSVVSRPLPYAMQQNRTPSLTAPAGGAGVGSVVAFKSGLFTQIPQIYTCAYSNGYGCPGAGSLTITGFTARYFNPTAVTPTSPLVYWQAIQMMPATAAGPSLREIVRASGDTLIEATCHTPDCANADIPIELAMPSDVDTVACGVCAQWITDVTTGGLR